MELHCLDRGAKVISGRPLCGNSAGSEKDVLVVEITGMPGAGKSTLLEGELRAVGGAAVTGTAFSRTWSHGRSFLESLRFELRLWQELVLQRPMTAHQAKWLWRKAGGVDAGIGVRLNILRNCLLKFAYRLAICRMHCGESKFVYVDEGISHIPFLLQGRADVDCAMVEAFVSEFGEQLREVRVLFVDAPQELVRSRLRRRGHKRIAVGDERSLRQFVEASARTAECLKRHRDVFASFEVTCSR